MRDFKNPTYDGPDCVCCKANKCQKDNETVVLLTDEVETERIALAWERERFDRLWQLEMDICKCEEAMQHLKVRMGRTRNGIDYDLEFGENK